ncbi:MAG: CHASE4 domain-containing protein [Desulfocapsaceae bacterium]|nr:CHASE4 domain-containing protein [Desulfocapsaceae bacterium]
MLPLLRFIQGRTFLSLLLLVSIYSIGNYFIIRLIVSPQHLQFERHLAQLETERLTEALLGEEESLKTIAHDWSAWDDTYDFVQNANPEYITSNLSETTFTNLRLNLLSIYRLDGSLVWSRLLNLETEKEMNFPEFPPTGLASTHPLLRHPGVDSLINGIIKTAHGPLLIVSQPIITSENTGPIIGTLIFGRLLTKELMAKFTKQTKVNYRLLDLDEQESLAEIPADISALGPETPFVFYDTKNRITAYSLLPDYLGKPQWLLEVHTDRPITENSRESLHYVLFVNMGIGLIILLFLLLLYRNQLRTATSTVRDLIAHTLPSQTNGQPEGPLAIGFNTDEFSRLGDELRSMIANFEQTTEQQKNIISEYTTSRRQLNSQMVKEIKKRLQIEEDLHKIQRDLERQVEERTRELRQTNIILQDEIIVRKEKEDELINHRKRLRALSSELMQIEDKERRQLATDLHDHVGQSLSAVKMYVDGLIASASYDVDRKKLQLIASIVEQTVQDVRTLTFELSPPILYELGLKAALEWLAEDFQKKYSLQIKSKCDECPKCTTPAFLALLFRTIRELLINVVRHAHADTAEVEVRCTGKGVRITVRDYGCGMKDADQKNEENTNTGFGLFSVRERVINIGGTVVIDSQKGQGTTITLTIPIKEACTESGSDQI